MTTDITIRTNGAYVSEGTLTTTQNGTEPTVVEVRVGPGTQTGPAEQRFTIPHNSSFALDLVERQATEEEKAALLPGGPVGDFQNGEFVEKGTGAKPHRED